jgi:hypothetical protein
MLSGARSIGHRGSCDEGLELYFRIHSHRDSTAPSASVGTESSLEGIGRGISVENHFTDFYTPFLVRTNQSENARPAASSRRAAGASVINCWCFSSNFRVWYSLRLN